MKKTKVFISYRNIIRNNTYENYLLLLDLKSALEEQNFQCKYLPPEKIPKGTIFSPYDIAAFLQLTFTLIDDCDKFIILDKDYFSENGEMTSIWTEAEFCIWSYYSRKEFLNRYKTKDSFYTLAKPSDSGFLFYQSPLYNLSKAQRTLLRVCSLDFDRTATLVDFSTSYRKTAKYLMAVCSNCQKLYTVEAKKLKKMKKAYAACSCGNVFQFGIDDHHFVCNQISESSAPKNISIFDALELLFEKKPVYELLNLSEGDYS